MPGLLNSKNQHQRNNDRYHNQNDRIAFHKTPLQSETIQERKIVRQQSEFSEHQKQSESNEQASADNLDRMHVTAESTIEFQKTLDSQGGQKKRHGKPEGVNS